MSIQKKLIHVLEMHDEAVEDFGLSPEVTHAEWEALVAAHSVEVEEITEEEFEQQKVAA
jgi:hypothetical protein